MPTNMKKTVLLLFILTSIFTISSCKKEDDKTWTKSILKGTWEQIAGTDFVECPEGNNKTIVITEADVTEYYTDEDGCSTDTGESSVYSFNGKVIELVDDTNYEITELTSTNITFDIIYQGYKVETATYTKQ